MGKSPNKKREYMKKLNKKAAYDLGRKAIYFTVAIFFIAIIFVYVSNSIKSYQRESLEYMHDVIDLAQVAGIEKCISQEDNGRIYIGRLTPKLNIDSIKQCLEKNELQVDKEFRITAGEEIIATTDDLAEYKTYVRYFILKNETKRVIIEVEKSEPFI